MPSLTLFVVEWNLVAVCLYLGVHMTLQAYPVTGQYSICWTSRQVIWLAHGMVFLSGWLRISLPCTYFLQILNQT